MFLNAIVDFMLYLCGVLHVVGCVCGLVFLAVFFAYCYHGKYDGRIFWFIDDWEGK